MISRKVIFVALALLLASAPLVGVKAGQAVASQTMQTLPVVDDFENGLPAGWFQYGDYGSGTTIVTEVVADDAIPGLPAGNHALEIAYTSAGWGAGTGHTLDNEDWSPYEGLSFWFFGANSGAGYRVILSDNLNPNVSGDTAERFAYEFDDNFSGWQLISIPWADFFRDYIYQPPGAPDDGLTLTTMQAYALALPAGTRTARLDHIMLMGEAQVQVKVAYESSAYRTTEGSTAAITVTLNVAAAVPVTVTYATADSTAVAGVDYTAAAGQLVFAAGSTEERFSISTLDNTSDDGERTVLLSLSDPVNAVLGPRNSAVLTIADNDAGAAGGGCHCAVIDDFEDGALPSGQDSNGLGVGFVTWNAPGAGVTITTTLMPPAPVPGAAAGNRVLREALTIGPGQWAGFTHAFSNDALNEWTPQDWSGYEGFSLWLYGNNTGGTLFLDILDNRNSGSTRDDAERWSVDIPDTFSGWQYFEIPWSGFHRKDIGNGAPNDGFTLTEVHGYGIGGYGNVNMGSQNYYVDDVTIYGDTGAAEPPLKIEFAAGNYAVDEGDTATITVTLNITSAGPVSINYTTAEGYATPNRDYVPTAGLLVIAPGQLTASFQVVTLPDLKAEGSEGLMLNLHDPVGAEAGFQVQAMLTIHDDDQPDPALLDDFEGFHRFTESDNVALTTMEIPAGTAMALPGQGAYEQVLSATYGAAGAGAPSFTRHFPAAQDWSGYGGLKLWVYGHNSGWPMTVHVLDNQATTAQTPPAGWQLMWSDEFNAAAGSAPNVNVWSPEIGDGTLNGIPGWGNSELEYYTDNANAATDGNGNLAITLDRVAPDSNLLCWYGPCQYTSARLVSAHKIEAQYGRIEARIRVPDGAAGLWPAFWMLGANINEISWPQSGEIDIMEYVSRNPNEVFGTIHGPGYSGGAAIGQIYTMPQPVAAGFHTFAIEWSPDELHWYVDGVNYHNVTAAQIAPREWVFNHPFYMLLNLAVGGNFGGSISPDLTFPQYMLVDYVRVYQAADSAERFQASFTDSFSGWRQVTLPFSAFTRSAVQPVGAPNDGFGLNQVWGYDVNLSAGSSGTLYLDQVRLAQVPTIHRSRRFNLDEDTFLNGAQPDVAYGNVQTMWLGFFNLMRPLVHAPIAGIPADAEVDAAYLYLYVTEGRGFSTWANSVIGQVSPHAVTTPWSAATAMWTTPWSTAGGDYGPAPASNYIGLGKLHTWLRLDVTDAVQAIVSGAGNYGFIVTSNEDHGVRYAFASQNYWDASKAGYVRVYYRTVE